MLSPLRTTFNRSPVAKSPAKMLKRFRRFCFLRLLQYRFHFSVLLEFIFHHHHLLGSWLLLLAALSCLSWSCAPGFNSFQAKGLPDGSRRCASSRAAGRAAEQSIAAEHCSRALQQSIAAEHCSRALQQSRAVQLVQCSAMQSRAEHCTAAGQRSRAEQQS